MPVAQYDKMLYTDIVFVEQLWAKALDKARRKHQQKACVQMYAEKRYHSEKKSKEERGMDRTADLFIGGGCCL